MTIQEINKKYEEIEESVSGMSAIDFATGVNGDKLEDIFVELSGFADVARETILSKISETDFVKLMTVVKKITLTLGATQGQNSLLISEMSGELNGYTHTVVLSVIGALIGDEVL